MVTVATAASKRRTARSALAIIGAIASIEDPVVKSVLCAIALLLGALPAAHAQAKPVTTASGLVYESLKEGTGAPPKATDVVRVHYRGTFPETGKEFDSSHKRGEPTEFPLNAVIPCWTEGVQKMKPGGKAKLSCPPAIAYGPRGAGGVIPPNATLNFEIELISVSGR
ncbi:MAG: FKBP-type peptidyl-prolyl cis-trans isomerase [Variovorax sp.]|nr:MAG: FKBP-type peptidyl-prolyl cis-trans isomerase [Variovorax sp.]